MSHANALLTPRARLRLARLVIEDGWTYSMAAKMFMVSPRTAAKWANRYRCEGPVGMADRSSRPHHSPNKTPEQVKRQIVQLRWRKRLGPVQIAGQLGVPASTVHAVLTRCRINSPCHIDRITGEPIRRYEHDHPGSVIHVDVTKFGNIPGGGGWRYLGKQQGDRNRVATKKRTGDKTKRYQPRLGHCFVHTVVDDHSRVAYAETCPDEKAETAVEVLQRAVVWFADRGVTVERVSVRQRLVLPLIRLARHLQSVRDHPQANPALPAADQRQDRTIPPNPVRLLGLRPPLQLRSRTPRSPADLAALLQSPPSPQRHRRPTADQLADHLPGHHS